MRRKPFDKVRTWRLFSKQLSRVSRTTAPGEPGSIPAVQGSGRREELHILWNKVSHGLQEHPDGPARFFLTVLSVTPESSLLCICWDAAALQVQK